MKTLIQLIETHWTRRSRGAPEAAARNAVPELLRFPAVELAESVLLQQIAFHERDGFAPQPLPDFRVFAPNDATRHRLTVEHRGDVAELRYFGTSFTQKSPPHPTDVLRLEPGSWLRIVGNRRTAHDEFWSYEKFVFNIVHLRHKDPNALVNSQPPIVRLDRQISLW